MIFGARTLQRGFEGKDVVELQLRLAGFAGTVWDGDFGPKTETQVKVFQADFMGETAPSGIADQAVFDALDRFAQAFPISFDTEAIRCPLCVRAAGETCTQEGFGQGRYQTLFLLRSSQGGLQMDRLRERTGDERAHQYEYPGIHKALFHTLRAFRFYAPLNDLPQPIRITSGYRCHINNVERSRRSTNHMGKALDLQFVGLSGTALIEASDAGRALLELKSNCQTRWDNQNQKALEPGKQLRPGEFTSPSWIHLDVREYDRGDYLQDHFFIQSATELDNKDLG